MFSSLLRSLPQLGRKWKPLNFSNPNFVRIPECYKIEGETLRGYVASKYYPTRIGEVIKDRCVSKEAGLPRLTDLKWIAEPLPCYEYYDSIDSERGKEERGFVGHVGHITSEDRVKRFRLRPEDQNP